MDSFEKKQKQVVEYDETCMGTGMRMNSPEVHCESLKKCACVFLEKKRKEEKKRQDAMSQRLFLSDLITVHPFFFPSLCLRLFHNDGDYTA